MHAIQVSVYRNYHWPHEDESGKVCVIDEFIYLFPLSFLCGTDCRCYRILSLPNLYKVILLWAHTSPYLWSIQNKLYQVVIISYYWPSGITLTISEIWIFKHNRLQFDSFRHDYCVKFKGMFDFVKLIVGYLCM